MVSALIDCAAVPFVFVLGCGENGVNPGGQSPRVITRLETRFDFVFRDLFAQGVWQRAFQAVAGLNGHLPILDKDEKNDAIVFEFLSDPPDTGNADGVIINGRVGLHLRINRNDHLIAGCFLEVFQLCVELISNRRRNNMRVIVEVARRCGGNDLRAERH